MQENDAVQEQTESEGGRRGMFDRARGGIGSAKQKVSRSVDVMTGADIRRFDEFTDATTRAVVGVHQDLSELQEQGVRTHRAVDDIQEREQRLAGRLDQLQEQVVLTHRALNEVQEREQRQAERLDQLQEQVADTHQAMGDIQGREQRLAERLGQLEQSVGRRTRLIPWIVGATAVALMLSIVAVLMSVS